MTRSRRRKITRELTRKHRRVIRTAIPVASTLLAAAVQAAFAQQAPAPAGTGGLQEIVVTAQKRVENLQDVPISVQVLDTAKLEQLNIVNIDDYVKFAPGIAYVRGEGQGGNGEPGESTSTSAVSRAAGRTIRALSRASASTSTSSRSRPSTATSTFTSTTFSASRSSRGRRARSTARARSRHGAHHHEQTRPDQVQRGRGRAGHSDPAARQRLRGRRFREYSDHLEHGGATRRLEEHDGGYISNVAGTNANACIFNGVRTFGAWSGQAEVSAYQANGS